MDDKIEVTLQCMEQILWDFMDIHDFLNGRKGEISVMHSLILVMSADLKPQMKDIAEAIGVSNSTVTDYVDYLENKGYVRRVRRSDDRRQIFVEATDKGTDWIERNKQITRDYLTDHMAELTPKEQDQLVTLLVKLVRNTKKSPISKAINNK